jgi:hypothetical protein
MPTAARTTSHSITMGHRRRNANRPSRYKKVAMEIIRSCANTGKGWKGTAMAPCRQARNALPRTSGTGELNTANRAVLKY